MATCVLDEDRRNLEATLVGNNLALVDYAVNHLANRLPRHVPRDELVSAAMAGLAQAARSYDPDRDTGFEHYASARIRGALLDELRSRDWASRSVRTKARRLVAATDELTARLGRVPTTEELAAKLGMVEKQVTALHHDVHRSVVLNYDSIVADSNVEWALPSDDRSPDVVLLERERRGYLLDAVSALPDRLRQVVVGYFFEERSMQQLAEQLGVSASRISQMRSKAMSLLKDGITSQLDPETMPESTDGPRVARRKAAYVAAVAAATRTRDRSAAAARIPALTA
ncbi:MAG TPA: sigma-70 family RNA polymerase sigma factor [Acidimicrobiales bacterium]|jgi:RNA polymerase sigma factor FliA|nr:sigma-70 family RNA polymerase sigma factor [Acidimicrobiales bacterium]